MLSKRNWCLYCIIECTSLLVLLVLALLDPITITTIRIIHVNGVTVAINWYKCDEII